MPKSEGKKFRIQVPAAGLATLDADPADPMGTDWASIANTTNTSLTHTDSEIDSTDMDSVGWREIFTTGGTRTLDATATFHFTDSSAHQELEEHLDTLDRAVQLRIVDLSTARYVSGIFHFNSFTKTGETEGLVTADVSFNSTGVVTRGDVV